MIQLYSVRTLVGKEVRKPLPEWVGEIGFPGWQQPIALVEGWISGVSDGEIITPDMGWVLEIREVGPDQDDKWKKRYVWLSSKTLDAIRKRNAEKLVEEQREKEREIQRAADKVKNEEMHRARRKRQFEGALVIAPWITEEEGQFCCTRSSVVDVARKRIYKLAREMGLMVEEEKFHRGAGWVVDTRTDEGGYWSGDERRMESRWVNSSLGKIVEEWAYDQTYHKTGVIPSPEEFLKNAAEMVK